MQAVRILGTGAHVPARVVTNSELDALIGESTSEWLIKNVGIRSRHWLDRSETTSDLVAEAARRALVSADIGAQDLDLLIVSTDTPDYLSPATSAVVQHKLGAIRAGCFDVNSACAGWVTALDQGARYLRTEVGAKYVLVAGGYAMSRFLDIRDKTTANLFADGAGAAVLGVGAQPGWLSSNFKTLGNHYDALGIFRGGAARPCTEDTVKSGGAPKVEFVRRFPANFNTEHWPELIRGALSKASLTFDDVGLYLFTQLNLRTIERVMETIGQPLSKTHWVMDKWGYTGSPCVVMALDDAITHGRGPQPGAVVVFCASGGGVSMAASVWRWT